MARIRYLKPEFFEDEHLAELSFWVRLLYAGLWTIADREGRLEDRPNRIKIKIFPYDKVNIEEGLQILSKIKVNNIRPFIYRYCVDLEKYIQIIKWKEHQRPHHTEKESVIPPYTPLKEKDKENGEDKPAQSELEVKQPLNNGELTVKKIKEIANLPAFEFIWSDYPKPIGKKNAFRHFKASVKTEQDIKNIIQALQNYKQSKEVKKGFIQNGSTWFNNWQDWVNYQEEGGESDVDRKIFRR